MMDDRDDVGPATTAQAAEVTPPSAPVRTPRTDGAGEPTKLDRRGLFRAGAAIAVGAALPACGRREEPPMAPLKITIPTLSPTPPASTPAPTELVELTCAELQARLTAGTETSRSLVAKYRQRIAALDQQGPMLRAVLELNPEADAIATQLDGERAAGKKLRGPLHGLPILVKDNIDTGDQMTTTAGSLALEGARAAQDAFVVARLRAAGAVILGKANLSEWANFRGMASSSGWSARGGQCRNPYALDRTPSGSSSGSAVAAAASLCAAAIGSETDGSIVSPSSCNGLVGVKPTIGLVSRAGVIPLSPSQDTLGPMTRSVTDAAVVLTVIAGPDPADPVTTAPHKLRPAAPEDYTTYLDAKALAGARLGVPRKGFFGISRGVDAVMTAALAKLTELGAVLVDPVELAAPADLGGAEIEVLLTELKVYLNQYLAGRAADAKIHSLAEAIAFNTKHADRELAIFGQEYFAQADTRTGLTDKAYVAARARCLQITREQLLDKALAQHKLDGFVAATNSPAWLIDHVNGDAGGGVSCSSLPAVAGYPHVTVPGGDIRGLPVGLSFFGRPFAEGKLLGYAFAFEQATRHRKPPRYLPTVELA